MKENKENKKDKLPDGVIDDDVFEDDSGSADEMDIDVVKAMIDEFVSEEAEITEDEEVEIKESEKLVILEADTLEKGLKKASELLEVSIKEIKYKILDNILKDKKGNVLQPYRFEFTKKVLQGDFVIQITNDKLKAYLRIVYPKLPGGKEVEYDDIMNALKNKDISFGIKENEIRKLVDELKRDYDLKQNILVAEGIPPEKGKDGEEVSSIFNQIKNKETNYDGDLSFMYLSTINAVQRDYHAALVVKEKEEIAVSTRGTKGKDGKSIFGETVPAEKGREKYILGENVSLDVDDNKVIYKSKIFGYVQLNENELSVISPLWISDDNMEAYFINLPQLNENKVIPYISELDDLIKQAKIEFGKRDSQIRQIPSKIKDWNEEEVALLVAEGRKPVRGADARIDFYFNTERKPGKILEDGSIDFKEQELIPVVKENQLLAAKYPPQEGTPGKDLRGEETPAEKGKDKSLTPQNNVRVVQGKGKTLYFSTIEGKVQLISNTFLSVNKHHNIKGNVDYSTGNVYFNGDVNIKGSVLSGFKVKAEGSVTIKGTVNPGAEIYSGGDVMVGEGVVGKGDTIIVAKGSVKAKFLQNSTIEAEGDIIVGNYILNCIIRCGGKVITPPKEYMKDVKGSIAGGTTNAVMGIKARNIGSDFAKGTKIIVGNDWKFEKKIKKVDKAFEYLELSKKKLLRTTRISALDHKKIKEVFSKLPPKKQRDFLKTIEKIKEFERMEKEIINKKKELISETKDRTEQANIQIMENLFPGVYVQIGESKIITELPLERIRMFEDKNKREIIWKKLK